MSGRPPVRRYGVPCEAVSGEYYLSNIDYSIFDKVGGI